MLKKTREWKKVCGLDEIPPLGSRVVKTPEGTAVAIFRNAEDEVFAVHDKCPHKGGPLSQGIVHGRHVTCPLHAWKINLKSGEAEAPDEGCAHLYSVHVAEGQVYLEC